jgi:GntR family transcriptional regulator/MocR family aminotransferase
MVDSWSTSGIDLHLDVDPALPRRAGLEQALRALVRSGRLTAGTRLPSSRALATQLGLSRGTVTAAYDQLVAEGYLDARHGSGTTVAALPQSRPDLPAAPAGAVPGATLDLRPGTPDTSSFPRAAWLRASRRAVSGAPPSAFGYGDPAGRPELRRALVEYLARTRGVVATPEQVVVTTGAVQALALLAGVLVRSGCGELAMEDPGLPYHREVVTAAGLAVRPVRVDEWGVRTDLLRDTGFRGVGAVLVTPAHQYPTGVTLQPQRRHDLVRWARESGGLVVEDDYDGEFRYDRQPVGSLQGTAPGEVVYVGSTAKTLGPGVRIGWAVVPPRLVDQLRQAKRLADRQGSVIDQLTLAELISSHDYDRHVRVMRQRYRARRDQLLASLRRPGGHTVGAVEVAGISAGLHVLLRLSGGVQEQRVLERAAAAGLELSGLGPHWHHPQQPAGGLVVGYAAPGPATFRPALAALSRALAI